MESKADGTDETIELASEAIFEVLYHQGDMDLRALRGKVNTPPAIFDMAIGSLVGKDDVQLLRTGDTVTVHRAPPAPAVFPLRSN